MAGVDVGAFRTGQLHVALIAERAKANVYSDVLREFFTIS